MEKENFKSGFVGILGRPNAGKSTLLNKLVGKKISIISPIPQTTRHQIKGVLTTNNAQIVFVDTPGVHSFNDKLTMHLNTIARRSIEGCDLIIYTVDVTRIPGKEEERLMEIIAGQDVKTIMVLNKIDLNGKFINNYIDVWEEKVKKNTKNPLIYFIPVSAKTGQNTEQLMKVLVENLPQSMPYYDRNVLTDFPLKFRIADIIREKLFLCLDKELPHSLAVEVESIESKQRIIRINVIIYVQRNSQKRIVVGKNGQILKQVGESSRKEIEELCKKKVFLETWVKVLGDWQRRPRILKELGY